LRCVTGSLPFTFDVKVYQKPEVVQALVLSGRKSRGSLPNRWLLSTTAREIIASTYGVMSVTTTKCSHGLRSTITRALDTLGAGNHVQRD
jgi:hypothetical protein